MPHPAAGRLSQRYLEGLSQVPLATGLLTTDGGAGAFAQTVTGWCPLPGETPALMVCLDDGPVTAAVRTNAGFRMNVLAVDHDRLADDFTGGGALHEPSPAAWDMDVLSGPTLRDGVASFACRLTELRVGGGRAALFGELLDVTWRDDAEPLMRLNHRYRRIEELPLSMFPGFALAPHERTTTAR